MRACFACSRAEHASLRLEQHGQRLLCPVCAARYALLPQCAPFQHDYRGHTAGGWLCVRCGYTLASVPLAVNGTA